MGILIGFALIGCQNNLAESDMNQKTKDTVNEAHMTVLEGNVSEIIDDNTVVLKITKERSGYNIDDKLTVSYDFVVDGDAVYQEPLRAYTVKVNDTIAVQFEEAVKKDGMDYVKCNQIAVFDTGLTKQINDGEYTYDYGAAVNELKESLVKNGIMENLYGSYEDGSYMFFEFDKIETIDNEDYYMINVVKEDKDKKVVYDEYYVVLCNKEGVFKVLNKTDMIIEKI